MSKAKWIIKLLSGPHAGAEMHLENRMYRVGHSDECDIVIHDRILPAEAFQLEVSDTIRLLCEDESLVLSTHGSPMSERAIQIIAFEVYSVGLLHFCFGPSDSGWPEIQLPGLENVAGDNGDSAQKKEAGNSLEVIEKRTASTQQAGDGYGYFSRSKVFINLSIFVFFVACGVVFNSSRLDAGMVMPASIIDVNEVVLSEPGFEGLEAIHQPSASNSNQWLVRGYVHSFTDTGRLEKKLQTLNIQYDLDIRSMEGIQRSTETLLKQFDMDNLVVAIGVLPGELSISGVQQDLAKWQRVKALLLADIPGLTAISDQVENPESRLAMLQRWIREENLDKEVIVNANDGRLSISSEIQLENSEAWQRINRKYHDLFGSSIDVAVMADNRPVIDIRGVSLGSIPYVVLADGRRYGLGSHLKNGFYLELVQEDAVVLKRGKELVKYRVGAGAE
ncbi:EscD/YscD/HrpQ family type III secretion system inner membrane ring protein [Hahella sp. CCB-MM4]|uniref:type III secretion system inner membrane ring subunit SctD n=1 Tax=Hahella sp. (strain CCB-MM4) TaxID=1926491 RepID=UPI000B9B9DA9|nr:type III secretion system inner membrane ring subunit SctD [Hahella sp. CCB-MM4]OZG74363.1 EscD/YscD/HrpQ family type III secretion system inner membrane ring protein [Hahella sp. CCB-MM4]